MHTQAAPRPLPLKPFCAASARERVAPAAEHNAFPLAAAVAALVRARPRHRVLIALGARAAAEPGAGDAIRRLAEQMNAPVLTRLDAKVVTS